VGFSNFADMQLDELLQHAQAQPEDNTPAMNEVVRRLDGLAIKIAGSITGDLALRQDLANAARLSVVQAVRNHDGRRGFLGYARRYMKGAALRELSAWVTPGALIHTESTTSIEEADSNGLDESLVIEDEITIDGWGDGEVGEAVANLTEPQQDLVILRYVDDMALEVIATLSNTTVPAVSQRLATCHRHLIPLLAA
jgi:RNA polymerase sigma factor (sigma-70 family)